MARWWSKSTIWWLTSLETEQIQQIQWRWLRRHASTRLASYCVSAIDDWQSSNHPIIQSGSLWRKADRTKSLAVAQSGQCHWPWAQINHPFSGPAFTTFTHCLPTCNHKTVTDSNSHHSRACANQLAALTWLCRTFEYGIKLSLISCEILA